MGFPDHCCGYCGGGANGDGVGDDWNIAAWALPESARPSITATTDFMAAGNTATRDLTAT